MKGWQDFTIHAFFTIISWFFVLEGMSLELLTYMEVTGNMEDQKERRRFLKYLFSLMAFGAVSGYSFGKGMKARKSGLITTNRSEARGTDSAVSGIKKIAVEEHFTTEKICNYIESRVKAGAEFNLGTTYNTSTHTSSFIGDNRLQEMDEAGIEMQVISPVCVHEGLVDPKEGAAAAKVTNDETYRITKQYPKRFAGFAGLSCLDPEAAAKELERSVKELGLKGAMIYSHIQGQYLDDKKFWPIFETAEKLGVPIYLHPKEPVPSMLKLYVDYGLWGASWGFAAETGLHAMRLISSGLFDKYPGLKMILGHGGEGLPYWLHRMGMGEGDARSQGGGPPSAPAGAMPQGGAIPTMAIPFLSDARFPRALCKKSPGQYVLENFYVTTSGMFWEPVLMFMHSVMGPDKVLFATDYPAESSSQAAKKMESLTLSNEDKKKILYLNSKNLFGL